MTASASSGHAVTDRESDPPKSFVRAAAIGAILEKSRTP
jgi:hypothetical protein